MVNEQRMLAEFFEFVKIKSVSRAERQAADLAKTRLVACGVEVFEDEVGKKIGGNAGNVIGLLRGTVPTAPAVLLSAHLDSVEPGEAIQPTLTGDLITAAGDTILGGDDKSGLIPILEALRVVQEHNLPHGDIQVIFTVAEEIGLQGSNFIDRSLLRSNFGYILDAGGPPGEIVTTAPGQYSLKAIIRGKTAHAGAAPEEGVNAIVVAGKALAELRQGRIDFETTANVGLIKGGTATNIVPDYVEIACEARSRDPKKLETQVRTMIATFTEVAAANGAQAEITVNKAYASYCLTADLPVVALARQGAASIGLAAPLRATGGGSDANHFNQYGLPCVVLATGMSKIHTTDEYLKASDLYTTARLVLAIIRTAAEKVA